MTTHELREKRAKAIADARAILDAAGDKGLSAEDAAKYDAHMAESDNLKKTIERMEQVESEERSIEAAADAGRDRNKVPAELRFPAGGPVPADDLPFPETRELRANRAAKMPEYARAYKKALYFGMDRLSGDEKRALSIGADTAGGYLVPDEFNQQLIQDLNAPTIVRQRATVLSGVSGDRQIPFVSAHGEASWIGEGQAFSESDETFGNKVIGAHKLGRLIKVSVELMQDSVFDLQAYLAREFARAFNAAEDAAFISGNGVGRPRGFTNDGTLGVTASGTTSVTADELIDLQHALPIAHRSAAVWYVADATMKAIRKLKTGDGQYLFVPGLQAGQSDTLLGKPIAVSDDVPAMTSGLKPIWYGNLSYLYIIDRAGFYLQLLKELYAANGQVAFLGYKRTDGRLLLDTPMVYVKMA